MAWNLIVSWAFIVDMFEGRRSSLMAADGLAAGFLAGEGARAFAGEGARAFAGAGVGAKVDYVWKAGSGLALRLDLLLAARLDSGFNNASLSTSSTIGSRMLAFLSL